MTNNTILVIGSTGKTGKRIAGRLVSLGIPVRHGCRSAEIPFDWDDQQTWPPALAGVAKVYISYHPDLAVPGSVDAIRLLTKIAGEAGVRHVVLLSGRNEAEAQRAEDVVRASGLAWTILRCAFFAQNFDEGAWLDEVLAGTVTLPVDDVLEPFVDVDDIADVAVAALTDDRHLGELYELTGPRLLRFRDAVSEIGEAAGRDIAFAHVPIDDYTAMLADHGLPPDFIWLLNHLFTEVLGSQPRLADGVARALGREGRDFRAYARDVAATGAWTP
ncbi:NmrA family transcriptional regulator [Mycolicibacterium moriokaense]|nr:NmrA family transcriptional regulator [Mycolicibacterium moriokaense]